MVGPWKRAATERPPVCPQPSPYCLALCPNTSGLHVWLVRGLFGLHAGGPFPDLARGRFVTRIATAVPADDRKQNEATDDEEQGWNAQECPKAEGARTNSKA